MKVGDKIKEIAANDDTKINRYMRLTIAVSLCKVLEEAIDELDEVKVSTQFEKLKDVIAKLQKEAWEAEL